MTDDVLMNKPANLKRMVAFRNIADYLDEFWAFSKALVLHAANIRT